ncbi:MAG: hypothetical protein ACREDT_03585 [Methylocella sp.]
MRNDHGLQGAADGAPRHLHRQMTVTEQGLLLGDGTLLAKMADDGLRLEGEEERILTLLAVAYGRNIPAATLGSFRRASKHWQSGDKCLAAIHLAQNGLGKLDAAGAYRLQFGTYDFQRDKATNTYFDKYVAAANYAIGVYMAGAGFNLEQTYILAQGYALFNSSNWYKYWSKGRAWVEPG